uniref:TLC domain containing 3A n=1 Tax=Salarias fasciatus TaxID=181472 RepID=A0A672GHJ1_SALFA
MLWIRTGLELGLHPKLAHIEGLNAVIIVHPCLHPFQLPIKHISSSEYYYLMLCWRKIVHWLATHFVIWYGVPYMTYDIFAMYLSHYYRFRVKGHEDYKQHSLRTVNSFVRREFLLVLHHIALLTILLPVTLVSRGGDFFIGCLFLTELSTPFVSLGKILIQVRQHDCWLHKANGGMVLFTFFMCRIALFPFMYWMYGRHYGIPLYSVPFHLPLSTNLGNSCILAPQVYWFVLLCRKGYRLYQRSRRPAAAAAPALSDSAKDD